MKWRANVKNITKRIALSLKNPIMHNHVVYGQEVLPGLSYIDMIYQVFREHGYSYSNLQLRNLSIYNPLTLGKASHVMLNIQCVESKEGCWHITIEGHETYNDVPAPETKLYVKAEMHEREAVVFEEMLTLHQLKQSAKETVDLSEIYEQRRHQELVHTGLMKAEGQIYATDADIVIDITLGPDGLAQAEHFLFHPALIDGSGVGSGWLLSSLLNADQKLYLPLFYESFCASAPVQTHCYTRVQRASVRLEKELIYLTLEFFDASGQKIAELKNFASKLVRGAELIHPERAATTQPQREASAVAPTASSMLTPVPLSSPEQATVFEEIEDFLRQMLAQRLNMPKEQIETEVGYYQMGLDSRRLLEVVQAIESKIGTSLSPILLFEYTTIAELATFLAEHYAEHFHTVGSARVQAEQSDPSATTLNTSLETEASPIPAPVSQVEMTADIAIIGMAGRYPQAATLQEFWDNLTQGKDCITEIPASRWDWRQYDDITSPSGKHMSHWGGFIDDPDCFDPQFFHISPREAETMDPQERLFLQACWETIEDAGYTPRTLVAPQGRHRRHPVGVFVGVMHKDYTLLGADAVAQGHHVPLSLNYAQIANRVSYHCNFHGPSMAIDTVCSSSLTAVHLAVESIRRGECQVALAGGVNLSLHPQKYLTYGSWDMHSSDGRCRTFGQGGDGYVSAEGIGAVLLKPLRQAEQDGDRIYAVIKGSAINHVGMVSGISVPSSVAQADAIEQCLEQSGIDPRTISYVDAHGTGTSLGDPIEIQGLVKAFSQRTQEKQFCAIGSVKSNIGHAESAAGISGLSKVVLQLYHRTLVPSLHAEDINPHLNLSQSPFYVQRTTEAWQQPVVVEQGVEVRYPRRAGLSSLGATGSNAHLILEEYIPQEEPSRPGGPLASENAPVIVPLSARNRERLQAYAKKMRAALHGEMCLADVAYTLQVGREAMEERVVFVVSSIAELNDRLAAIEEGQEQVEGCWRGQVKSGKRGSEAARQDQSTKASVRAWIERGDVSRIAEAWAQGLAIDWKQFYGETRPQRLSLPTYPFEKVRYWLPESDAGPDIQRNKSIVADVVHPLLHQNVSNIEGLCFTSVFTGREFSWRITS